MKSLLIFASFFSVSLCMPGGWKNLNTTSKEVKEVADFATETLSGRMNSPYHSKVITVTSAKRQVVAGMQYNLTIELSETKCRKNVPYIEIEQCSFLNLNNSQICDVTVWIKKWISYEELKYFSCSAKHSED